MSDSGIAATVMPEAARSTDADLAAGDCVGEYKIVGKLGVGGFGVVFSAVHPMIGKRVAIKVLNRMFSADPSMVSRFVAEARAVNQIRHKNIIDIFSFGALADGRQYYVMELLGGMPLDSYLNARGGRLGFEETLPILRAIARALDAAHAAGIAHRDLKPENIFIADDDGTPFPKLLDFGIAKLLSEDGGQRHKTRTGSALGTPYYMSPEQCRGRDVDHRTDIYSFGIMTYQILTGALPFRGEDFVELLLQQTSATAVAPSQVWPYLPPALDAPILHMMEKDPAHRPQNLTAALDAMYAAVGMVIPRSTGSAPMLPGAGVGSDSRLTPSPLAPSMPPVAVARAASLGASFVAAEAGPRPAKTRSRLVVIATSTLVVAAGVLVIALRGGDEPPRMAAPPPPPAVAAPAPAPAPVPRTVPRPEPEPAPAPITTVEIDITAAPKGTQVYGPGKVLLGQAPGKITVPRGDAPYELTLKLAGYTTRVERIAVTTSTSIALPLARVRVKQRTRNDIPNFD